MSMKNAFIEKCPDSMYYFIQVWNPDGTSFILYQHKNSSLHDLYKHVKLHKNEDLFTVTNILSYQGKALPNYGHTELHEAFGTDNQEIELYYKHKKDIAFEDLSPKDKDRNEKWVWEPAGGFVCGR